MTMLRCCIIFVAVLVLSLVDATPAGWKMTDRFAGFRYEIIGKVYDVGMRRAIKAIADELNCFGWAQYAKSQTGRIVGEVRCNKRMTEKMKQWMVNTDGHPEGSFVEHVNIKDYEDSKIRLHFSHFKILDTERITCFRDPPHQCPEFAF